MPANRRRTRIRRWIGTATVIALVSASPFGRRILDGEVAPAALAEPATTPPASPAPFPDGERAPGTITEPEPPPYTPVVAAAPDPPTVTPEASPPPEPPAPEPPPAPTPPPPPTVPEQTPTATPKGTVPAYDKPDGASAGTVSNTYYGIPTVLPVIDGVPGWVRVRRPERPNGSTVWVRDRDVTVGTTPWRIVVQLSGTRLLLFHAGRLMLDAPAGIGTDRTPTPVGEFFVTHHQAPPSPGYGPVVVVTSAHSEVLTSFGGFPDAIVAFHGPVGAEAAIGTAGAKVSTGCVRLLAGDLANLGDVAPGSPVQIMP
jgi:hypothetical protein